MQVNVDFVDEWEDLSNGCDHVCGKATEATWEDRAGQGEVLSRRKRNVQKRVHISHQQLTNI